MATKVISALQKVGLERFIFRYSRKYFMQQAFATVGSKKLNYSSMKARIYFRNISASSGRSKVFKSYGRTVKYIPRRYIAPKLICPSTPFPGRFLEKGCSAAIICVTNPDFESKIILKQPYKYHPDHRFESESGVLAKLSNHPNIIQLVGESVTDICQDPNFRTSCPDVEHYGLTKSVILERMDTNLEILLKEQELTVLDRVDVLTQILEAQVYMRNKSICHRDLKPSNILVNFATNNSVFQHPLRFVVKVADFDCALDLNALSEGRIFHQGAPMCTPPEILNNSIEKPDAARTLYSKSDIWAIGLMAYELFKNENPFTKIAVANYSMEDLPPLHSAPNAIQKLVKCLLDPDPNSRYQSCIASDILQLYRFKSVLTEDVFNVFKNMSLNMFIGCCYFHHMYLAILRFAHNPARIEFALNFIDE